PCVRPPGDGPRARPQPRLRLPGRAHLPRGTCRPRDRRGPDRLPRAQAWPLQDVAGDRARGAVEGAADAPAHAARRVGAPPGAGGEMTAHITQWIADLGL